MIPTFLDIPSDTQAPDRKPYRSVMATFLYRLGRWSADHTRTVVAIWLVLLTLLGVGAVTVGRPPTNEVSIPGSTFQRVLDDLGTKVPEAAGGFGTVVLHSESGAFTESQKAAIRDTFAQWGRLDEVTRVIDPFVGQASLDQGVTALAAGRRELDAAKPGIEAAQQQLWDARAQLDQGQGLEKVAVAADPNDPNLPGLRAQLADGEKRYADGHAQFMVGYEKYRAGEVAWQQGKAQIDAINGMRLVSEDGRTAVAQIQFDRNTHSIDPSIRERIPQLGTALDRVGVHADYSVDITQDTSVIGIGEVLGLMLAGLVLIVMLGTLVAAGLPLAVALLGVGVGVAGALTLTAFYEMNSMTPALALMLGLAVGIDYALFIVNRHRGQILHGMDLKESIGRATGTSGNAVFFAGTTVVIALAALVISGIPLLAQMGFVAAGAVAVAVAVSLTLVPALLGALGTRVLSKRAWRAAGFATPGESATRTVPADDHEEEHGGWYVALMTARPWATIVGVLGVVAVLAVPALDLRLGLPGGGNEPADSTAYKAYAATARAFGPGVNGPVLAMAELSGSPSAEQTAATKAQLATALKAVPGVEHVLPFAESADHRTLAFQVVPSAGPSDAATVTTVHALLDSLPAMEKSSGTTMGLTGQTVANIEMSETLGRALPPYLAVVVGLSLIILTGVFRSIVVPIVATVGFLLSVAAAFGTTVAVFQWGWLGSLFGVHDPGPILSFMPIMLIGVLFGLAMDYQMFLVSGMREAVSHGEDPRTAVRSGFMHGAKVVTAAAVIMFAVFGGFVWSHLTMIRPMGFGLAVGVLVDAVLIRMTLTPAIMHLLGARAWWMPRWMERLTPDLDVEGTSLSPQVRRRPTPTSRPSTAH